MNDDVKHLIEQLREPVWGEPVRVVNDRLRTAALFLESLAAELEQVKQERDGLNILLGQAQSMLETRTRERDEAVEVVKELGTCAYCEHDSYCPHTIPDCMHCKDERCQCYSCGHQSKWQWRGVNTNLEVQDD